MRLRSEDVRCFICSFLSSSTTTGDADEDRFGLASVFLSSSSSSSSDAVAFFLDVFEVEDFDDDFDFDDFDFDDDFDGDLLRLTSLSEDFLPLLTFDGLLGLEDFLLPLDFFFEDAAKTVS